MSQDMPANDRWRQSIQPRIEAARESLRGIRMDDLARSSGVTLCGDGIKLALFATSLRISLPEFEIRTAEGAICREDTDPRPRLSHPHPWCGSPSGHGIVRQIGTGESLDRISGIARWRVLCQGLSLLHVRYAGK